MSSIVEFFQGYASSNCENRRAALHCLDYSRRKKEEERQKREAAARAKEPDAAPDRFRTGELCPLGAAGRFTFDGHLDGTRAPAPGPEEAKISVRAAEPFPPITADQRDFWWQ